MKDKRQRQTTPWPIDPNFLTLMVHQLAAQQNAAAQIRSNPWPFGQAYNQPAAGKILFSNSHWLTQISNQNGSLIKISALASNPLASQLAQNPQMLQAARLAQTPHAASPFPNYPLLPNAGLMASTMLQMASQRASQAAHSSDASVASEVSERTRIIPNEITEQRPASPATSSETGNEPNVTSDDETK